MPPEGEEVPIEAAKESGMSVPISNEFARLFLLALLSYHPEK